MLREHHLNRTSTCNTSSYTQASPAHFSFPHLITSLTCRSVWLVGIEIVPFHVFVRRPCDVPEVQPSGMRILICWINPRAKNPLVAAIFKRTILDNLHLERGLLARDVGLVHPNDGRGGDVLENWQ